MDTEAKLGFISDQMQLEPAEEYRPTAQPVDLPASAYVTAPCGSSPAELQSAVNQLQAGGDRSLDAKKNSGGVYAAAMPGGKRIALLKTMWTAGGERDCFYCPFRARRNFRRAT